MCPYDMYAGNFRTMVQGNRGNVLLYIFKDSCPLLIMCIIPMIVAVFLFVIQIFFYKSFTPLNLFNLGCCFLLLTIWSFTEARGWQFFAGNAYVMQMINFVAFSMVIATIAVAMKQMKFIVNEKHFKILLFIDIAIPAGQIVVQLLEIADFFEMLTIIHIMDALNLFVFITDFVIELLKGEKEPKNFFRSVVIYLSTISCLFLDLMDFYVWDKFGNGFFSRIELLIIMMVAGICAVKKSITIYAENIEKKTYERMAYTDDMTHMRNRRAFDRDLENLEQYNEAVTILYADMNGLKQINDCMGHQKGDEAIRTVAEKLHNFQEKGNFCYRIGGDEFCILGSSMSAKEMEQECIRINEELQGVAEKFVYPISIAYGAMDYEPEKNEKIFSVMKMADKRMYEMKEGMKNGLER